MSELNILMLESLLIIVTIAFVMTRISYVRKVITQTDITLTTQLKVILIFGLFGIIGTYTGITFNTETGEAARWQFGLSDNEAIVNFRVLGIATAGLLGGVRVGLGAGLIAGIHRYLLGGFSAFPCSVATIFAGLLSGLVSERLTQQQRLNPFIAFLIAITAESIQMLIILIIGKPFDEVMNFFTPEPNAWFLVKNIAVPMIILNGLGCGLFILIVRNALQEAEHIGALQAKTALRLAQSTLKYMSQGLSPDAAKATCKILLGQVNASAVAITDQKRILAHIGAAADHHQESEPVLTGATRKVLQSGKLLKAEHKDIKCSVPGCELAAAIIAPLKRGDEIVGTLKFYYQSDREIDSITNELISGLSDLLSMQLNIAEADRQKQLAKQAGIRVRLSEDVIHFVGNAMTAVNSLIRTDRIKARQLVNWISRYVRSCLERDSSSSTTIDEELEHVKNYLAIQQTTYAGKLLVNYQADNAVTDYHIPPLILMALVDNAIKHGAKKNDDALHIDIIIKDRYETIIISVADNGSGIPNEKLHSLGKDRVASQHGTGLGLFNVNRSLSLMFGKESSLRIKCEPEGGTEVFITIPKILRKEINNGPDKIAHHR